MGSEMCIRDRFGRLVGGRTSPSRSTFAFRYISEIETWSFEITRTEMDMIADGSKTRLTVTAFVRE